MVMASKPTHLPRIDDFFDYLETTWIGGRFMLQHWNVYENDTYCTNSHVKGWYTQLKRAVGKPQPNIDQLVEVIQREQAVTEISMLQLNTGAQPRVPVGGCAGLDIKISVKTQRFFL